MSKRFGSIILLTCLFALLFSMNAQLTVAYPQPLLKVEVRRYYLTAGDENELKISITNEGDGSAYDVKACLTVPSTVLGMAVVEGACEVFNEIEVGETKHMYPLLYVASSCPLGAYSLMLTLQYRDEYGNLYADSVPVGVVVDSVEPEVEPKLDVAVSDYNVTAGVENTICIILTNTGEKAVYNVKAVLTSTTPGIVVLKNSSYTFEEIGIQENATFKPVIGVSKTVMLGPYSLALTLKYEDDEGITYHDQATLGILVSSVFSRRFAFRAEVENPNVVAGAENGVKVVLTNIGDAPAYNVEVQVSSANPYIAVLSDIAYMFSYIKPNDSVYLTPTIGVSRNTPLGPYSLTLTIKYEDEDGSFYMDNQIIGIFVSSAQSYRLTFRVELENYRVKAGVENEVGIVLTNMGDAPVYDVNVVLSSASPYIAILRGVSNTVNVIEPNASIRFVSTIGISRGTPLGVYPLTIMLKYKDSDGSPHIDSLNAGVLVDSVEPADRTTIVIQGLQITPSEVYPGREATLEVELENLGARAHDVRVQLTINPQVPIVSLSPTIVFIGDLEPNQTAQVVYNFHISGEAKAQPYTLQLSVFYYDMYGQPGSVTETLSVKVQGITSFHLVNIKPSDLIVESGELMTIEADLLLIGTEAAEFVNIEIVEDPSSPFSLTSESREYIGRVDPDSPVPFDLQFVVKPNATEGGYPLRIRVSYWDTYKQEREDVVELPVTIEKKVEMKEGIELTTWDIIWRMIRILLGIKP